MTKRTLSRNIMLGAGILAVLIILLSHAFHNEACSFLSKMKASKTEKTSGKESADPEKKTVINVSSEAVTSGPAVEVAAADLSLIREITFEEEEAIERPVVSQALRAGFFKILLRTVIAPQAP